MLMMMKMTMRRIDFEIETSLYCKHNFWILEIFFFFGFSNKNRKCFLICWNYFMFITFSQCSCCNVFKKFHGKGNWKKSIFEFRIWNSNFKSKFWFFCCWLMKLKVATVCCHIIQIEEVFQLVCFHFKDFVFFQYSTYFKVFRNGVGSFISPNLKTFL